MKTEQCLYVLFVLIHVAAPVIQALDNGLALTPPMGWMTWQRFRCQINCESYPDDCISEKLIQRNADRLLQDGFVDAGYKYVVIDDCWPMRERDRETSKLIPDTKRFPGGMHTIADYLHQRNMSFGIYLDYGTLTCEGYPGSIDYLELDAKTLAEWEVDYVKMDGCYAPTERMPDGYQQFAQFLNQTKRPIVFSCSYPAYINWQKNYSAFDWEQLKRNCNLWRMLADVDDRWTSIQGIIDQYRQHSDLLARFAGPKHWNDPDMLVLGNFGLSPDQERVQMGMWCMFAAPLLISVDMDRLRRESADLMKNKILIEIDQDEGGFQASYIGSKGNVQLWSRKLTRTENSWAIAMVNMASGGGPIHLPITLKDMGIPSSQPNKDIFELQDVFTGDQFGVVHHTDEVVFNINPTGIVMYRVQLRSN